jgi:hypothetical protein
MRTLTDLVLASLVLGIILALASVLLIRNADGQSPGLGPIDVTLEDIPGRYVLLVQEDVRRVWTDPSAIRKFELWEPGRSPEGFAWYVLYFYGPSGNPTRMDLRTEADALRVVNFVLEHQNGKDKK